MQLQPLVDALRGEIFQQSVLHASGRRLRLLARHGQNDPEIAIGRSNWLFARALRAGKRAAAVMSLIQSARMNGHDPYAYLTDALVRLPTHKASRIAELLPHRWHNTFDATV